MKKTLIANALALALGTSVSALADPTQTAVTVVGTSHSAVDATARQPSLLDTESLQVVSVTELDTMRGGYGTFFDPSKFSSLVGVVVALKLKILHGAGKFNNGRTRF